MYVPPAYGRVAQKIALAPEVVDLVPTLPLIIYARLMLYRAFAGALALALTLVVLNWALPELAQSLVEVILKVLHLISALLDTLAQRLPAQ